MTKKKLKQIYTLALVIGLPASLYTFVYATNVEKPKVESMVIVTPAVKPITLAENTKPATVVKKPATTVKKAPIKKKVVKKKKKEKLTTQPALFTPTTAPHTSR